MSENTLAVQSEDILKEYLRKTYDTLFVYPNKVLEILNDFYGEDNVDMQYKTFDDWYNRSNFNPLIEDIVPKSSPFIEKNNEDYIKYRWTLLKYCPIHVVHELLNTPDIQETVKTSMIKSITIDVLIHFPHIRVTNENDRYTDINHVYIKLVIDTNGCIIGNFRMNKSEYTINHFASYYIHSHCHALNYNSIEEFQDVCLGTGPIKNTIRSLNVEYNEDLWKLFCLELHKYLQTESLKGIPYLHLENITDNAKVINVDEKYNFHLYALLKNEDLKIKIIQFINWFIAQKELRFGYYDGHYMLGMPYMNFIVVISNAFIKWVNLYNTQNKDSKDWITYEYLLENNIIIVGTIKNGLLYKYSNYSISNLYSFIGKYVCTFKNKCIKLNITRDTITNNSTFLNPELVSYILNIILCFINYNYGRIKTEESASDSGKTYYL